MAGDFSMFQPPKSRYLGLLYVGISYQLTKFCWVNQLWLRYVISVDISYIYIYMLYPITYVHMYIYIYITVARSRPPKRLGSVGFGPAMGHGADARCGVRTGRCPRGQVEGCICSLGVYIIYMYLTKGFSVIMIY